MARSKHLQIDGNPMGIRWESDGNPSWESKWMGIPLGGFDGDTLQGWLRIIPLLVSILNNMISDFFTHSFDDGNMDSCSDRYTKLLSKNLGFTDNQPLTQTHSHQIRNLLGSLCYFSIWHGSPIRHPQVYMESNKWWKIPFSNRPVGAFWGRPSKREIRMLI